MSRARPASQGVGAAVRQGAAALALGLALLPVGRCQAQPQPGEGLARANATASPSEALVVYDVTLNEDPVGSWLLIGQQGRWFAPEEAFRAWRLPVRDDSPHLLRHGQRWLALHALAGLRIQEDSARQALAIWLDPSLFEATRLNAGDTPPPSASPVEPALFLNLDLNYTHLQVRRVPAASEVAAFAEVGWSSASGVLTSTLMGRQALGNSTSLGSLPAWVRLETAFARQDPAQGLSLRLGDSVTRTGITGRSVYFGGVQWGTNTDGAGGRDTGPKSVIAGTSPTPGTVELFVNDVLRQTSRVPSGPFAIDVPPLLGLDGQVRVVVRDLLGRETVISQPIFRVADQLDEGMRDWSVAVGAVRQRLGLKSNDYGERFGAALLRLGLTKALTSEWQGHWSARSQSLGMGMTWTLPPHGLAFQAGLTASRGEGTPPGSEWLLGAEMRRGPHTASVRLTQRSAGHRVLGEEGAQAMTSAMAHYAVSLGHGSTLGLGAAWVQPRQQVAIASYSASFGTRLPGGASFNLIASQTRGQVSASQLTFALQMPLPGQTAHSLHLGRRDKALDAYVSASGSQDRTSWRVQAGRQDNRDHAEASLWQGTDRSHWSANLRASPGLQALRLGWQGGLIAMGGRLRATHKVNGSFALVEVPGIEGALVGPHGDDQTSTDSEGFALVTDLPHDVPTPIRLNPESLPLGADVPTLERTGVPRWRSGIRLRFPVRAGRSAMVQLRTPDGLPLRAGANVLVDDDPQRFVVGPRGETFITGLRGEHKLSVRGDGLNCRAHLAMPAGSTQDIERIGPITCTPRAP